MYYPTADPIYYRYMTDLQNRAPGGWCPRCGREIYRAGENLCEVCLEEQEESDG